MWTHVVLDLTVTHDPRGWQGSGVYYALEKGRSHCDEDRPGQVWPEGDATAIETTFCNLQGMGMRLKSHVR